MPALVAIGEVLGAHGIGGELRVGFLTDFPERFVKLKRVFVTAATGGVQGEGQTVKEFPVEKARLHGNVALLKLAGIDDRSTAMSLKGSLIQVQEDELMPLPEGHYYVHHLIGLGVFTVEGVRVGTLRDVLTMPGNDVYVVRRDEGGSRRDEVLIPAVRHIVKEIDPERGVIIIDPIEGLID